MEETERPILERCDIPRRDRRNQRSIILWGLLWMVAWVGVNVAINHQWLGVGGPATVAAALTGALGLVMLAAYRRYLREADELRRKIELDALAVAFGAGVVGGMTYWALGRSGAIAEPDMLHVMLLMIFAHAIGVVIGHRRYA